MWYFSDWCSCPTWHQIGVMDNWDNLTTATSHTREVRSHQNRRAGATRFRWDPRSTTNVSKQRRWSSNGANYYNSPTDNSANDNSRNDNSPNDNSSIKIITSITETTATENNISNNNNRSNNINSNINNNKAAFNQKFYQNWVECFRSSCHRRRNVISRRRRRQEKLSSHDRLTFTIHYIFHYLFERLDTNLLRCPPFIFRYNRMWRKREKNLILNRFCFIFAIIVRQKLGKFLHSQNFLY